MSTTTTWRLYPDGSFDLSTPALQLTGCYPAIDGVPVRPLDVSVSPDSNGGTIHYRLPSGALHLRLAADGDGLILTASLSEMPVAPRLVDPLGAGRVRGADRFFRQGVGLGGPTEFIRLDAADAKWPLDSYTVSALVAADDQTLTVAVHDHRRFIQRCQLDACPEPSFAAGFLTEGIPLPGGELRLPDLHFRLSLHPWDALRQTAAAIGQAMYARTHQPISFHWCSWYYMNHNLTEEILEEYLAGFRRITPPLPMQTIQIDCGYQSSAGDWLEARPSFWPSGLQGMFRHILDAGYRAGIWLAPFMVGNRSHLFAEHPDWVLRDLSGAPVTLFRAYNEPKLWGYRDEEYYVLDTSHPQAMEHLRHTFRTLRRWGATFFKTDFIVWGLQDSTTVRRHTPGKTSAEYLRDLFAMIREEIGEESFWLGCIAPYAPFIGYADAMRIGGDVGAQWEGFFSPENMLRETQGTQYFNNIWWQNDPDAILLRDFHTHLSQMEVRSLALWQGILGGVINTSCPMHEIAPDRLALWRFLQPGEAKWTANLPYFGKPRRILTAVRTFGDEDWAILAFNATDGPQTEVIRLAEAVGVESLFCYRWSPDGSSIPLGRQSALVPELARHSSELYYVTARESPPGFTLGGRRL